MEKGRKRMSSGDLGIDIASTFFKPIEGAEPLHPNNGNTKITVVGVGNVGMAVAQTILTQELTSELALVDVDVEKLMGIKECKNNFLHYINIE
ncbi:hypothetical protein SUGI_0962830 [Cryptomeria japonica]|nr:hypothetical protein SUGI_0962830 [Cryptomeria japonica]